MAAYNIGPKIGIEGEKEFRAQISRINKEYSAMESYTKAVSTAMQQQGKSQELLASKSNSLRQQIGLQEQKYKELAAALEKVRAKEGASAQEILRYEGALLDVENAVAALSKELADTEDELDRMARGLDDVGDAAEVADDKVLSFGDMLKAGIASGAILNGLERAGDLIVEVGAQSVQAAAEVKAANAQFRQTFGDLEATATSALRSISDETGIAVTRLQGGYTALYAFTKSVGGDQDTALNIAQRALTAAADSAAYYDRTMEDATETLQSFLKGNYENDAALGIAATETTRNAKANELYAKSFKDLTEAQKVDTLLAMVEAGNKASGALGQAAREADSWANVTGELAESWRQFLASLGGPVMEGLIPVIQGITQGLKDMTAVASWQELRTGVEGFREGLAAADAALESSNGEIAATAGLAQQYVKRLQELEEAGLSTAESQREYKQVVELLNALMPDLGLTINAVTGRLDQNTDAIRDNIKSLKDQAKAQAQQSYYKKIIDESAKAYESLYEAEARQAELLAEQAALLERGAQAHESMSYAQSGSTAAMSQFNAALSEDDKRLAAVNLELAALGGEIRNAESAVAAAEEKVNSAAAAYEDYSEAGEGAAEAATTMAEAQAALSKAYATAKNAARESIDSQIGLFSKMADESDWSAERIIENWEKQREAFANYEDNLKKAVELGLDETLVKQLSDGSQQSMMILDALVNDAEVSVDQINAAFGDRLNAADSLAAAMADMQTSFSDSLNEMLKNSRKFGYDSGAGIAQGIRDATPLVESAYERLAKRGQGAYMHTMDQHSPSRVMRAAGKDSGRGAALGVEDAIPDMERAMMRLAQSGSDTYLQEQLDYVAQYPAMVAGAPGYGGGTTTNTRNVTYGGIFININTQPGQDSQSIADAVLQELTVRLGQEEAAF
ncbi:MAG: hypothetical protein J6L24_03105 [Oscillospiraceae bacterium]|nr:hypothetical protein [Oscillospiraceae bacterium]